MTHDKKPREWTILVDRKTGQQASPKYCENNFVEAVNVREVIDEPAKLPPSETVAVRRETMKKLEFVINLYLNTHAKLGYYQSAEIRRKEIVEQFREALEAIRKDET